MTIFSKLSVTVGFIGAAILSASSVMAEPVCSVDITGNDAMQYSTKEIVVSRSCENFTINLEHVGKLPKTVMGHNVVIVKTDDVTDVANASIKAGAAADYLLKDDERIVAETTLVGGGEKTSVTFETSKLAADQNYTYFCSFPGHNAIMRGVIKFVD